MLDQAEGVHFLGQGEPGLVHGLAADKLHQQVNLGDLAEHPGLFLLEGMGLDDVGVGQFLEDLK
ncbi:MAG: hypothetical protein ACKOWO_05455, partial [Sediminibacterium sp.]